MELNVNEDTTCKQQITASLPTNILSKQYTKRYKQQKRNFF